MILAEPVENFETVWGNECSRREGLTSDIYSALLFFPN